MSLALDPARARHGLYRHGPAPIEPAECCDRAGARALADRIAAYWAARGAQVEVRAVGAPFAMSFRGARYDVRSDMVDGLPRGKNMSDRSCRHSMTERSA